MKPMCCDSYPAIEDNFTVIERLRARVIAVPTDSLLREVLVDLEDSERSFELRWKADMRAIKRWQAAGPNRQQTWPDHADLCVWLMEQLEASNRRGE